VIRDPEVRDDSLWDLFNQCLIGDENDHLQLITCLKQIGEALHNYSELVMQQEVRQQYLDKLTLRNQRMHHHHESI
jgi:DNA-directed RNA polymerase subunit N (RpoN/RPB10)